MMKQTGRMALKRALPLMVAVALGASGCAGVGPQQAPEGEAPISPSVQVQPPVKTQTVTVFYPDWQVQHVIPEQRQVPEGSAAELATRVVEELLAGPADPTLQRPFPDGTRLLEPVSLNNGVATVNLSEEANRLHGSASVVAALSALRLSLSEIPGIVRVQLQVDGRSDGDLGGMVLEVMDRGLYLYPVLPNPERIKYLQGRADQGLDPWRRDPLEVAHFEGRMFGFTAAELEQATIQQAGNEAEVYVTRDGTTYNFTLVRNQAAGGNGIWTIASLNPMQWHAYESLPFALQSWADRYTETTIGATNAEFDRLYLLASVEEGDVRITGAATEGGQLVVSLTEEGGGPVSIASVPLPGADLETVFRWETPPVGPASRHTSPETLPRLYTADGTGQAETVLTGNAVVHTTAFEAGRITVMGYARHLFEASISARLLDGKGQEVAVGHGTATASMWDWGEFTIVLEHSVPPGEYRLEIGDYSMRDGAWQPRTVKYVTVPAR
ncbi:GerMN domain-containing protein [Symbiobacterium terraclitae]|uniref:GerMN domain-containing protein n=1 Tax=Symbiobacterium terraclitae TaxID=557451 RepID=UPI0035B51895